MRVIMGVLRSKDGVYYVRKKVPAKLEQAVSRVLGVPRPRTSWLKRSLRTKDAREANIKAKPVLVEFDGVLMRAALLLQEVPLVTDLSETAINQMADYLHASMLQEDEEVRRDGTAPRRCSKPRGTSFATLASVPTLLVTGSLASGCQSESCSSRGKA